MTLFPESLFVLLILGGLALTVIGGGMLGVLVVRDWKEGKLW